MISYVNESKSLIYAFWMFEKEITKKKMNLKTVEDTQKCQNAYSYSLRASKFSVLKLTEIEIFWIYYTIPFGFCLILVLLGHNFSTFETTLFG